MRSNDTLRISLCALLLAMSTAHAEVAFQDTFSRPDGPDLGSPWVEVNETTTSVIAPSGQRVDAGYITLSGGVATFNYVRLVDGTTNASPLAYAPLSRGSTTASVQFTFIAGSNRMGHAAGLMSASEGFYFSHPSNVPAARDYPMTGLEVVLGKSDSFTPNSSICVLKFLHGVESTVGCSLLPFQFVAGHSYSVALAIINDTVTGSITDGVSTVVNTYPLNGFVYLADRVFVHDSDGGLGAFTPPGTYTIGFDNIVVTIPDERLVNIDIKPGDTTNTINLSSNGVIPVAILSDEMFDATKVDPAMVSLAGATVKLIGKGQKYSCYTQDVNADGRLDLVCNVQTDLLTLQQGDSTATLQARTLSGMAIRGSDAIRIVP